MTSCSCTAPPPPADVIFGAELRRLAGSGRLRLVERHTDADGVLRPADLDAVVPDWRGREAWLCGPTAMLDAFEEHYEQAGLAERLHTERFRPTVVTPGEGGTVTFARSGTVADADGATPILVAGEDAGVLMPSGCRMGICFGCVVGLREGAVRDLRDGEVDHRGAGGRRPHPDLRVGRGRPLHDRPLGAPVTLTDQTTTRPAPRASTRLSTVTTERRHVPKRSGKPDPTAHLSAEQVEALGRELDALRAEIFEVARRGGTRRTSAPSSRRSARSSWAAAPCCCSRWFPPGLGRSAPSGLSIAKILENMEIGHNVMHGQWDWMRDPKIHSTAWEWDNASPSELWKHSHNELHHTFTNVLGRDNDLGYGIMRVDEDQRWHAMLPGPAALELPQRVLLRVRHRRLRLRARRAPARQDHRRPGVPRERRARSLAKIRRQATKDYVVHPLLSRPVVPQHPGRQRRREPRPEPLDAHGDHVRALPRGRRDVRQGVDRGRDPRRVVPAADDRVGEHLRQQGHAPHDRQPVAPDRAPPVPRHAEQPVRARSRRGSARSASATGWPTRPAPCRSRCCPRGSRSSSCHCPTRTTPRGLVGQARARLQRRSRPSHDQWGIASAGGTTEPAGA